MFFVYPSWNHPIFSEWRQWNRAMEANSRNPTRWLLCLEGKRSIERIAEHMYPDGCVVGHMILEENAFQDSTLLEAGFPHVS